MYTIFQNICIITTLLQVALLCVLLANVDVQLRKVQFVPLQNLTDNKGQMNRQCD